MDTKGNRRSWFGWEPLLLALAVIGAMLVSIRPGSLVSTAAPSPAPSRPANPAESARDSASLSWNVRPLVRDRIPLPLGEDAVVLMRRGCVRQVLTLANYYDADGADSLMVTVVDSFGVASTLSDRPDSLVFEGTVVAPDSTLWLWHCSAPRGWDGARPGQLRSDRELPWPGLVHRFELARGISDAAAKECVSRAFKRFPEYDIRTQRRTRQGDTLVVSGEAFPIFDGLVRSYRCEAVIRGSAVISMKLEETR